MTTADHSMGPRPTTGSATSMTLLERALASDAEAWQRVVDLYASLVAYWCRRSGVRQEDIADVSQEVFRSVAVGLEKFRRVRKSDTFRGWLRGVTQNKALDWHRQRGRQPAAAVGGTEAAMIMGGIPAESECDDDPRELAALFRRGLELVRGEFEPETWTAFWRVTVDGHATADVAAGLGVSPAAVRKAKSRVLSRLKQELGDLLPV